MMNFVLIVIIFISLQYKSSQYVTLPQYRWPYYNTDRYSQTMYGYPRTTSFYGVYRNDIPENRSYYIPIQTRKGEQTTSQLNEIQEIQPKLKFYWNNLKKFKEALTTNNLQKTAANPNAAMYKGKPTRKTLASFRSASV